jgi:hypothetical protein
LRWLDRYERWQGKEILISLILCGEKNRKQIELCKVAVQSAGAAAADEGDLVALQVEVAALGSDTAYSRGRSGL